MKTYTPSTQTRPHIPMPIKGKALDTKCLDCVNNNHEYCHSDRFKWSSCSCWKKWKQV